MAAYKKKFNPDALPAQVTPEEAAQALGQLQVNQKVSTSSASPTPSQPGQRRPSQPQPQSQHPPSITTSNQQYQSPAQTPRLPPRNNGVLSPPPPTGYGWGPRPPGSSQASYRPSPAGQYPPRTPAPPDPGSEELWPLFQAANVSRTGALTTEELGSALVNADFTPFDPQTIKSLMRMFSNTPAGQPQNISFVEFQNLWKFLAAWRELFERFDDDRSGRISLNEFSNALVAFGYRLSAPFVGVLYNAYGSSKSDRRPSAGRPDEGMSFDLFVQACISLKRMTDAFKTYDEDRDGYVTLSFEEFLTEILRLRE